LTKYQRQIIDTLVCYGVFVNSGRKQMQKRLLILSCGKGDGHKSGSSKQLSDALGRLFEDDYEF